MFERFTERARQVVVLAQESAREMRHDYIGTEHILLGLIKEENGLAAKALGKFGFTPEDTKHHVLNLVGEGNWTKAGQLPFTPRGKKVFENALREALSLGHNYIGTEHILLALLREDEGATARLFEMAAVESDDIRDEVIGLLSGRRSKEVQDRKGQDLCKQAKTEAENSNDDLQKGWEQHLVRVPATFTYGDLTLEITDATSGRVSIRIKRPSGSLLGIS